jgi:hypothetical protein
MTTRGYTSAEAPRRCWTAAPAMQQASHLNEILNNNLFVCRAATWPAAQPSSSTPRDLHSPHRLLPAHDSAAPALHHGAVLVPGQLLLHVSPAMRGAQAALLVLL